MRHFIDCIVKNKSAFTDGKFGLKILKVIEAMYNSAKTKKIEEVVY